MTDSTTTSLATPSPLADIDRLLRGGFTSAEALRGGTVRIPARTLVPACLVFGALYGLSMGLFSAVGGEGSGSWLQLVSSAWKVPLLFLLTLTVTFPSLYVVSALARSRLGAMHTLRLLLAAVAVNLVLLASLAPVAAFFTLSTDSYPFLKLLHVTFFGVSGIIGLGVLWRSLSAAYGWDQPVEPSAPAAAPPAASLAPDGEGPSAPERRAMTPIASQRTASAQDRRVRRVFGTWIVIFGCVGAQMAWILRPFLGAPDETFGWFRPRDSNFLAALAETIAQLFGA